MLPQKQRLEQCIHGHVLGVHIRPERARQLPNAMPLRRQDQVSRLHVVHQYWWDQKGRRRWFRDLKYSADICVQNLDGQLVCAA